MEIIKPAIAGTLESSDVQITIRPNPGGGIRAQLESPVKSMFGKAILETVYRVLGEFDIKDAQLQIMDKGALDPVIVARMQAAICRACEMPYDWSREDVKDEA